MILTTPFWTILLVKTSKINEFSVFQFFNFVWIRQGKRCRANNRKVSPILGNSAGATTFHYFRLNYRNIFTRGSQTTPKRPGIHYSVLTLVFPLVFLFWAWTMGDPFSFSIFCWFLGSNIRPGPWGSIFLFHLLLVFGVEYWAWNVGSVHFFLPPLAGSWGRLTGPETWGSIFLFHLLLFISTHSPPASPSISIIIPKLVSLHTFLLSVLSPFAYSANLHHQLPPLAADYN